MISTELAATLTFSRWSAESVLTTRSEIGRMYCNRDGSFSVEVDNDVISQALVNHMKRRDDADRCSDLYTIEASNTLKTGHPSSTGFTVASDGSNIRSFAHT